MSGYVPKRLRQRSGGAKPAAKRSTPKPAAKPKIPAQRRPESDRRPRPSPGKQRPSPRPRGVVKRRRRVADLQRLAKKLAVSVIVAVAVAAGAFWGATSVTSTDDTKAAVQAAKTAASALFSYDYRDFDASVANAMAHATGAFAQDYKTTTEGLRESVESEKARIVADVVDVALLNSQVTFTDDGGTEYADAVEVLAFVDHIITNDNIEGSRVDQTRVVMTMYYDDGKWLTVAATSM